MAEYRNVSGRDRALSLSDWPAPKIVAAGETVVVEDVIADLYDFEQPGVWETVTPSPAQTQRAEDAKATADAADAAVNGEPQVVTVPAGGQVTVQADPQPEQGASQEGEH